MPNLPHDFAQLIRGTRRPFLALGAGMSFGLVPGPKALLGEKRADAEAELDCHPQDIDPDSDDSLYVWADEVVEALANKSEPAPKLRLAEALGLTRDKVWSGEVGLPLRGTTPRHRVLARFARERRWASLWSFNWDAHVENALERIGFDRDEPRARQPWPVAYRAIVTKDDFTHLSRDDLFCVLKPHGCVRALLHAITLYDEGKVQEATELANRLMITTRDLIQERTNPTDKRFFVKLKSELTESPMMVVGWSISEPYLAAVINDTIEDVIQRGTLEELTIADIAFNSKGHAQAASCYSLSEAQVFAKLETDERGFNTDALFLWLQASYALDNIRAHVRPELHSVLDEWEVSLQHAGSNHFLFSFADDFLPAWVRLCWRSELIPCAGYQPHELRLELEDFHIPWKLAPLPRDDLSAAGALLRMMPLNTDGWDLTRFPGALWQQASGTLVLPLPAWGNPNELAGFGPLLKILTQHIGYVAKLEILPLTPDNQNSTIAAEKIQELKDTVASRLGVQRFANSDNIGVASNLGAG